MRSPVDEHVERSVCITILLKCCDLPGGSSGLPPSNPPPVSGSGRLTMLRLRRSRLFLVLAAFSVIALYHFTNFGSLGDGSLPSIEDWKSSGSKGSGSNSAAESTAVTSNEPPGKGFTTKADPDDSPDTDPSSDRATPSQAPPVPSKEPDDQLDTSPKKKTEPEPQEKEVEEPKDPQNTTSFNGEPPATPAESVLDIAPEVHRDDSFQVIAAPDDGMPKIHWTPLPEHFAIPTKSLIQLPSGKPKAIPTIQFSKFPNESSDQKAEREAKLDKIKKTFAFSWEGYRKNAWMQDELSPVSGNSRNPFCGWAATLVDSLDSLWMLGMKKDFQEAVEAVGNIDFTVSIRNDLPLFEVTIRYLGGLLGAYDISEGKYRVLLDKAVELAEVLMGAFDTPNRMPMTYYLWKP